MGDSLRSGDPTTRGPGYHRRLPGKVRTLLTDAIPAYWDDQDANATSTITSNRTQTGWQGFGAR